MNKKVAIIRKDKKNNSKEWVYIVHDSIFDIRRKSRNIYTIKRLIELEKLIKNNDSISYEFKLIDDEEYETILANYDINLAKAPSTGAFSDFLVGFAKNLEFEWYGEPSKISFSNNLVDRLKEWITNTIREVEATCSVDLDSLGDKSWRKK